MSVLGFRRPTKPKAPAMFAACLSGQRHPLALLRKPLPLVGLRGTLQPALSYCTLSHHNLGVVPWTLKVVPLVFGDSF